MIAAGIAAAERGAPGKASPVIAASVAEQPKWPFVLPFVVQSTLCLVGKMAFGTGMHCFRGYMYWPFSYLDGRITGSYTTVVCG